MELEDNFDWSNTTPLPVIDCKSFYQNRYLDEYLDEHLVDVDNQEIFTIYILQRVYHDLLQARKFTYPEVYINLGDILNKHNRTFFDEYIFQTNNLDCSLDGLLKKPDVYRFKSWKEFKNELKPAIKILKDAGWYVEILKAYKLKLVLSEKLSVKIKRMFENLTSK